MWVLGEMDNTTAPAFSLCRLVADAVGCSEPVIEREPAIATLPSSTRSAVLALLSAVCLANTCTLHLDYNCPPHLPACLHALSPTLAPPQRPVVHILAGSVSFRTPTAEEYASGQPVTDLVAGYEDYPPQSARAEVGTAAAPAPAAASS